MEISSLLVKVVPEKIAKCGGSFCREVLVCSGFLK